MNSLEAQMELELELAPELELELGQKHAPVSTPAQDLAPNQVVL